MITYTPALLGGLLIGVASSLLLWGLGKITGISGIYSSLLKPNKKDYWKYSFLLGLITSGFFLNFFFSEELFNYQIIGSPQRIIIAGLLVGFGTRLGNGCTSGHGVCGVPRLAKRSILATITFILAGIVVVTIDGAIS